MASWPAIELQSMDWSSIAGVLADRSVKPLALLDHVGRVTLLSAPLEQLLGWPRDDMQGRSWVDTCVPPEFAEATHLWVKRALRGALKHADCTVVTRDGRRLLLVLELDLVGTGADQGLLLTVERASSIEPERSETAEVDYEVIAAPTEFGRVERVRFGCSLHVSETPDEPCFRLLHRMDAPCTDCPVLRSATEAWPRTTVRLKNDGTGDFEIVTAERLDPTRVAMKVRWIAAAALTAIHQAKVDALSQRARLTSREKAVLTCLLHGQSTEDIARELDLSPRTVKFHVGNILQKLGADSRADLIRLVGY